MRIIALVKSEDHVCCRYRIAAFLSDWEKHGHTVEIRPWSLRWLFGRLLPGAGEPADLLIVQRKLFPLWQWRLVRRIARQVIFDLMTPFIKIVPITPAELFVPNDSNNFARSCKPLTLSWPATRCCATKHPS